MSESRWVWVTVFVGSLLLVGCEKHGKGEGAHHDEGPEKAVKTGFDDYSAAVAAIGEHLEHVEELIEHKELSELHKAAKPIKLIAKKLNGLALKEGSGVPREKLKKINLTSKALADTWEKIDEAGAADDLAGSKKVYREMVGLIETLMKFAHPVESEEHHEDADDDEEAHEEEGDERYED